MQLQSVKLKFHFYSLTIVNYSIFPQNFSMWGIHLNCCEKFFSYKSERFHLFSELKTSYFLHIYEYHSVHLFFLVKSFPSQVQSLNLVKRFLVAVHGFMLFARLPFKTE